MSENTDFVGVWVLPQTKRALRVRAAVTATSISEVVREALTKYVREQPPPPAEVLARLARGNAGQEVRQ